MYKKLLRAFITRNISLFTIIIISMSLSMIGYFVSTNLISNSEDLIADEIKPILGGDIIIDSGNESKPEILKYLGKLEESGDIIIAREAQIFTTIESQQGEFELANLSFVDDSYPFYSERIIETIDPHGKALLNEVAYDLVKSGTNTIELFDTVYPIEGIIKSNGSELNVFANGRAQVYLDYDELKTSGVSGENSLIEQNIYIKVLDQTKFDIILQNIEDNPIFEEVRVQNYKRGGERFESIISTLNEFIGYILIISFLFSVLIIFLSIESFFISEKKTFSILKILGLNIYKLIGVCLLIFMLIFALSFGISYVLSELVFVGIRSFNLSSEFILYGSSLPTGIYLGAIILTVSVLAPLLKFVFHSPLDGLKQNFLQIYSISEILIQILLIFIGIFGLRYILGGDLKSILYSSTGVVTGIIILISIITLILNILYRAYKLRYQKRDFIKYDAIRNTVKPGNLSGIIVLSFLIIYSSFIFISILFFNFYDRLSINVGNDKNIFIINVTEDNYEVLQPELKTDTYKILKARILEINNLPLEDHLDSQDAQRGKGRFTREFNITDNDLANVAVISGVDRISEGEVSIDNDFSKDIGVSIGDEVEFFIYGIKKTLKVSNIRESMTGNVNPFFYFQVHPEDFAKYPKTYFIATHVDSESISQFKKDTIARIGSNISFIEVDGILEQVKSISLKILTLIQVFYGYILLFSVISVIICIRFFKIFQAKKSRLYYILGANKSVLAKNSIYEYNYLQLVGALLSIMLASIGSYYTLWKSDFIDFTLINYLYSMIGAGVIFVLISLFIRYSLRR